MKKILSIILALIMAFGLVSSFAANIGDADRAGTKSIKGAYITYNGTEQSAYGGVNVFYLSDGTRNTFGARLGGEVKIKFGSEISFSGLRVWMSDNCVSGAEGRHSDSAMNGTDHRRAAVLQVKISSDGTNWTEITNERNANNEYWYDDYTFGKTVKAKYVSLVSKKSNDGWGEWEIGEIALITDEDISSKVTAEADKKDETVKKEETSGSDSDLYEYSSSWKLEASSTFYSLAVTRAFDDNTKTYWHSSYEVVDGQVASKAPYPHYIKVDFGETKEIAGVVYTPRTDNMAGRFYKYTIYGSTDGTNFEKITSGEFDYAKGYVPQYVTFDKKVSVKAIKIESTEAGDGFGSAAEIAFMKNKTDGKTETAEENKDDGYLKYDSTWKVSASSVFYGQVAKNAFDGNENTYWHTSYEAENGQITTMAPYPHYLTADFGKTVTIYGLEYVPRKGNQGGVFNNYTIYGSTDGVNFTKITSGDFVYSDGIKTKTVAFGKTEVRAIKIETTDSISNVGTAAEIKFLTKEPAKEEVKKAPVTEDGKSSTGIAFLDRTGWTATGKSFVACPASRILDGNTKTYWHSNYESADGVVTKRDPLPYALEITLPEGEWTSGISLHPRGDGMDVGKILKLDVYVKENDSDDYFLLFDDHEFALNSGNKSPREIPFAANVKVKKVKLEILEGAMSFGTLAEFNLWEANANNQNVSYEDFARVDAENRTYYVDTKDFVVNYDGECWSEYTADKMFDGTSISTGSMFQTAELKPSQFPVIIVVDMAKVRTFTEFHYIPRNTQDHHGLWQKFSVNVSMDDMNWETIIDSAKLERNLETKKFAFDEPVQARYMEIVIEEALVNRVSCSEIRLIQDKEAHDRENNAAALQSEKYELQIGSNVIKSEVGGVASEKTIDVAPYIVDGSTLIPLRGLVEEMGAEIAWDGATKTITLKTDDATIVLQIWNRRVFVTNKEFGEVRYTLLNFPVIKDSRTFIPVRFVSEQLGYNVAWDGATQTVTITK